MAKNKEPTENNLHPHEIVHQNVKRSNKIVTKDGKIKKKILKKFTDFQCDVCKKKFTTKENLLSHKKIHQNDELPCSECDYIGKNRQYLRRHFKKVHTAPTLECGVCGRAFHHPCQLKEHNMVHTGEKPLKCDICGKAFRVLFSLSTHMLIHTNEKPYKCSFCPYSCRDNSTLRKHEHRHVGIHRTYPCKICKKKFTSRPKLKNHISEVHLEHLEENVQKFTCEQCGKEFKQKGKMLKHVDAVHTVRAPCPCPICGRELKHEHYLLSHMRRHFPERPYVCAVEDCGRAFKDKGDLKKHSYIHLPSQQAACKICGRRFARAHRLTAHLRTHGRKPEVCECDYCGVRFLTKNYLIKHISQKHTHRKKYICDHCNLLTYNKPSIVMHLKSGKCKIEDLRCEICDTSYKRLNYLRNHYLRTHKMRYKPRKLNKKKVKEPAVKVKIEPVDPYDDVKLSLLNVDKEQVDVEAEGLENDLISYSKHVLSEDLQECLLHEPSQEPAETSFDQFLIKHVFQQQVKEEVIEDLHIIETDEEKQASVARKVEKVLEKARIDAIKKERSKFTKILAKKRN